MKNTLRPTHEHMRCVHCKKPLIKKTKDHVFPKSWYPKNTPAHVQRWTVPSCADCNGEFGAKEKELFIRLALCVDPRRAEASGLSRCALKSLGVQVSGISTEERKHRAALKVKILKDTFPYRPGIDILPGLGPHPGFSQDHQVAIAIPEKLLKEVAKKIIRGCEYVLGEKRLIEEPYSLQIYFAHEANIADIRELFERFTGPVYLGPGFEVRRAAAHDEPGTVLYKIVVWGSWVIYASIMDLTKPDI